jgi:hypothetical protein
MLTSSIFPGAGLCPLSVILLNKVGWKLTMQYIGLSAMIVGSLCLFFIKEPKRVVQQTESKTEAKVSPI